MEQYRPLAGANEEEKNEGTIKMPGDCGLFSKPGYGGSYCGPVNNKGKPHGRSGTYTKKADKTTWTPIATKGHWSNGCAEGFFRRHKPGEKDKLQYFHNGKREIETIPNNLFPGK